ncbi:hypothetical protein DL98DRAFT_237919 [Cadophora sp. DSE1049]|nr:hypothetical protein DL98DRAFT_237919 [Cadophora sp. DSE1049]
MKFKSLFCTARTPSASSSPSPSPSPAASDSDSKPPSPRYYDHHGTRISAMSYWQYTDPTRTMQPDTPPSLEQEQREAPYKKAFHEAEARRRAHAFAVEQLRSEAERTFLHLFQEEKALALLQDRAFRAQEAATTALLPVDENVGSISLKWAMKEVKRRLVLQEELDVAMALLNPKEMWVRSRRNKMESLKRELDDLGEWEAVEKAVGEMIRAEAEAKAEVEKDDGEEERTGMIVRRKNKQHLGAEKGRHPATRPLSRVGEERPPLIRRHAAVPWFVSWDM